MSLVIWYTVMGLGMAGLIWAAKKKKKTLNDKAYATGFCVVIVFSSIMVLVSFFSDPEQERAIDNANQFEKAKLFKIAEFVNKKYAGKDVVILVRQDMLPSENSDFVRIDPVKTLKKMLNRDVTVKDVVIMAPPTEEEIVAMGGDPDMMASFEMSLSAPFYNKKFAECRALSPAAIIDLAGLPMGETCRDLRIWRWNRKKDPRIVLPEVNDIGLCFEPVDLMNGILDSVIVVRNDRKFNFMDDAAPKDLEEAFNLLYVFVTKDNLVELAKSRTITIMEPLDD